MGAAHRLFCVLTACWSLLSLVAGNATSLEFSSTEGTTMRLSWTYLFSDDETVTVAAVATVPGRRWIGVGGASQRTNKMLDAECALGVPADLSLETGFYVLADTSSSSGFVRQDTDASDDISFEATAQTSTLSFNATFPLDPTNNQTLLVLAFGDDDGVLEYHGGRKQVTAVSLLPSQEPGGSYVPTIDDKIMIHVILMSVAWILLFPAGATFAVRRPVVMASSVWYVRHYGTMLLAVVVGCIGAAMAVWSIEERDPGDGVSKLHLTQLHHVAGYVVVGLMFVQPLIGMARPKRPQVDELKTTARKIWEALHHAVGYVILFGGIANIWIGALDAIPLLINNAESFEAFGITIGRKSLAHWLMAFTIIVGVCLIVLAAYTRYTNATVQTAISQTQVQLTRHSHLSASNRGLLSGSSIEYDGKQLEKVEVEV